MEKRKRENVEESVLGETAAVRSAPRRATLVAAHDPSGSRWDVVFSALFSFRGGEQPDARAVDMRRWWR